MEAVWQWISQNYEGILGVIWDILLFALTIAGVFISWKSVKMVLPKKRNNAYLEIITNMQKYLVEMPEINLKNTRSIIYSIISKHELDIGAISEQEIFKEIRSSILANPFLISEMKIDLLYKLDRIDEKFSLEDVQEEISQIFFMDRSPDSIEHFYTSRVKKEIFDILKRHTEQIQEENAKQIKLANESIRLLKIVVLSLVMIVFMFLGFLSTISEFEQTLINRVILISTLVAMVAAMLIFTPYLINNMQKIDSLKKFAFVQFLMRVFK